MIAYGPLPDGKVCTALSFEANGDAVCALVDQGFIPIGDGCCISARAIRNGIEWDFAGLPPETKRELARKITGDGLAERGYFYERNGNGSAS
jgi:hypothetical protein